MRAVLPILAAVILAVLAYTFLTKEPQVAPPGEDPRQTQPAQPSAPQPAAAERQNVTPTTAAEDDQPAAPQAPAAEQPVPPPADLTLVLNVRDVVTRAPIEAFRWRFVQRGDILRGESAAGVAELALPRSRIGDLLIEADGMQPFAKKALQTPGVNQPTTHLDVFLTPAPSGQGITLMVKDLDRRPIQNVRVDAFKLNTNQDIGWDLGQPLWARRADAADGTYQLPPLAPGDYGILLVATDADGNLLPLAPYRQTFTLTGSNGFLEDVPLEPACALRLDLLDANGAPFDPKVHGTTSIRLNQTGQTGIQRKWTAKAEANGTVSQADVAAGPAPIWLDQPVAPGSYLLEIAVNNAPRISQVLLLRPEQQTETIYIR